MQNKLPLTETEQLFIILVSIFTIINADYKCGQTQLQVPAVKAMKISCIKYISFQAIIYFILKKQKNEKKKKATKLSIYIHIHEK